MTTPLAGALLFLFFAPLAFIYGRSLAGRLQARARAAGRSAVPLALSRLVVPLFVAFGLLLRFSGRTLEDWQAATESGTLRAALGLVWFAGSLAGLLFFLAIPFVLGRLFALLAVLMGWFAQVRDEPLRFGASGFRQRAAQDRAEDEDG